MLKHLDITRRRLRTFLTEGALPGKLYPRREPVKLSVYSAPGRITFQEAVRRRYRPAAVRQQFGPFWSTHWFKVEIAVPGSWRGAEVHLLWDSCSEACVWRDGVPVQGLTGTGNPAWVGTAFPIRHQYILTKRAHGRERLTLYIEIACNHLFGAESYREIVGKLRQAEIATFDRDAWALLWDFTTVAEMAESLPLETPRGAQALFTANQMINFCDLDDRATWPRTRRVAREFLAARNGDGQHNVSAIGHAHIDTAWLWPLAETKRKCYRTFSTAVLLMDSYPEYKFVCSQAQQYEWMKLEQPALYATIKRRVREGRFIPAGGTWIEPDCNIPSGESLVRQFLVGQRFFQKEFGITCREFWNPDVFGYNGQLPQIMRGAGIRYFLTQKLSWNQINKPHSHTFWWEGIDGSRVLTHFPPADTYNANGTVKELLFHVRNYKDLERSNESYYLFGFGDGGGGPTMEMLERLRRVRDVDGMPRVEIRSPREFFARLEADAKPLTTQVGELYFEMHRGTYTTHARNKRHNRRCEELLHDVEFLAAMAATVGRGYRYPSRELEHLWKLVLLNQFHDIIPGSSITEVYKDSAQQYADVHTRGEKLREQAATSLGFGRGKRIVAINTLGAPRTEVVDVAGRPAVVSAPAMGYAVQQPITATEQPVTVTESPGGFTLENQHLRAQLRRDGRLVSLFDKRTQREIIERRANQFVLFEDEPMQFDAWDVDVYHLEKRREVPGAKKARVTERHPLRVTVEFQFDISRTSKLTQTVSLDALAPRLDFACEADWRERHKFLKVEFPTTIRAEHATYEIQFGHLQRPTHFNNSFDIARFEVSAHRWADLSEPGCGLALLNDCKYGHATHGNLMRLSLLRSPKSPDPEADMGRHQFRYALMPHAGDFRAAGVIEAARCFNSPLMIRKTDAPRAERSFFSVDQASVVIDTVKMAEDSNDLIVRLYEAHGGRCRVRLSSVLPVQSATRCNLLEQDEQRLRWKRGGVEFSVTPFQIVTLKLRLKD
jgi:alpha-mannosidase